VSPDEPEASGSSDASGARSGRGAAIAAVAIVVLGSGWFALAHLVMDEPTGDALSESLGVILGLLVVASVVGAFFSARGKPG
jgi:hypothetical protein